MDNKRKATVPKGPGTPKNKRFKTGEEDDEFKSGFAAELAAFEEDSEESNHPDHLEIGQGPENLNTNARWSRPAMNDVDPSKDTLLFQQIDLDFYEGPPMKEALTSNQKVPIFRIYGVNDAGNSILAHLYGYVPYLYSSVPSGFKNSDLYKCVEVLNNAAKQELKSKDVPEHIVLNIKIETKENIYGFHGNKKASFF